LIKAVLLTASLCLVVLCVAGGIAPAAPQPADSLCEKSEKTIFSCAIKKPAKIVSLCSSSNVSKVQGYIQYRFGLPGKIELEFPKTLAGTQAAFKYSHYFRAQVDETEISFTSEGYQYAIFDDYYGDENPAIHQQGVRVTAPDSKETTLSCRGRAKADYGNLGDVFPSEPR
jgi:hypothetical protein